MPGSVRLTRIMGCRQEPTHWLRSCADKQDIGAIHVDHVGAYRIRPAKSATMWGVLAGGVDAALQVTPSEC